MSTDSDSFLKPRYLSDASIRSTQVANAPCDLITFLAVIQILEIEILPITWQETRKPIGIGATSRINEALIDLHTSFAFKCVSDRQKERESEKGIIQALVNEVVVLGHKSIRNHSNVVELQGICWDVTSKDKGDDEANDQVWPVLVFKKTQYGDLYSFAMLPVGRELCFAERLKLCMDVGTAIWDMHSNNIVHGDIKPQNVLIYKDDGTFTARVLDFGYSTRFANEDDSIHVPKTEPWDAPEHSYNKFTPAQVRKMDVFSFGMLCMWVMFEKYLSDITLLPQEANWAEQYFQGGGGRHLSQRILGDLKQKGELIMLARQLVMAEKDLNDEKKQALQEFFSVSLACNPNERANSEQSFSRLIPNRTQLSVLGLGKDEFHVLDCSFEIILSLDSLYQSDYRVRRHIRRLLENRERGSDDQNLAFQLALSSKIGFGIHRDEKKLTGILHKSGRTEQELNETIDRIKLLGSNSKARAGATYNSLLNLGHIFSIDFADQYRKSSNFREAEAEIRREIRDIEHCIGKESYIWRIHIHTLSILCSADGRWKEAEELFLQVMETNLRVLGEEHPATLTNMANLASMYRNQGRWMEAEELEVQVMETRKRVLREGHFSTLNSIANLASTYRYQGRWKEAEELFLQVMETNLRVLGEEHPSTLISMASLASTYENQGRWKETRELQARELEICLRVLGEEHPDTLTSMINLASTFWNQGQWKEAEELEARELRICSRVLGEKHPDTLTSTSNLALTFWNQGRWKEAEELEVQVMETRKSVLGDEHPDMLVSMGNLAAMYRSRGRWKEAEELEVQVIETRRRVLGDEHPDTLIGIGNLASTYRYQERWKEAEELLVQIIDISLRVLGEKHPNTLTSMSHLASTYRDQGRWKEAEELEVQIIEKRKKVLGEEHPSTLISMNNLALTCWGQGRWKEAEELQARELEICLRVLGEEHPETRASIGNLASMYRNQGRWKEAEELYVRIMDMSDAEQADGK